MTLWLTGSLARGSVHSPNVGKTSPDDDGIALDNTIAGKETKNDTITCIQ